MKNYFIQCANGSMFCGQFVNRQDDETAFDCVFQIFPQPHPKNKNEITFSGIYHGLTTFKNSVIAFYSEIDPKGHYYEIYKELKISKGIGIIHAV